MRTVNYSDVLQGSLALAGIPLIGFDLTEPTFALMRTFHDRRLRVAWEVHSWPDICRYEQRSFAPPWNANTTYAAGAMVLDVPTLNYLQALQPSTGQPPTINAVTNDVYWAPLQPQYVAEPFEAGEAYVVAEQVLNPVDQQFYQLFAQALTITATPGGVYDGNYEPTTAGGFNGPNGAFITYNPTLPQWVLWSPPHTEVGATGVLIGQWTAGTMTAAFATTQGSPPGNGWGLLTPFLRTINYQQYDINGNPLTPLGEVFAAYDRDPRITTKKTKIPFTLTSDGLNFVQSGSAICYTPRAVISAYVWLFYRLQRPTLTGNPFDPALIYVAGAQAYYVNPVTGTGDFYNCTVTTTAGQSPTTTPASWAVIALPYIFREYLVQGGYADWLTQDGQTDKSQAFEAVAQQLLELEADKVQRQQQQTNRLDWRY